MRLSSIALVTVAVCALSGVARADQKMAYVDLQRALLEVEEGKAAKATLKAEFDKKQKTLDAEQEALKKDKDTLDKQSMAMTEDARRMKEQELMGKLQEVQKHYMGMQQELSEKERTLTQGIFQKMEGIIGEIAQAEGLTFVFDKSAGLVYAPPSLDLTNELIRRYNDKYSPGKAAGKAKSGAAKGSN
ncbi:MAG: OmpH family outer membrane protein [Deltaproteobacteria bacterium]|nr:OmpH family outer membrane protein [Deltaproteobacteria bacterium]